MIQLLKTGFPWGDSPSRFTHAWNRLAQVRKAVNGTTDGATLAIYRYDGLGRRITRSIQHAGDATATYHDYWSATSGGWQLLETTDHATTPNVLKQHVWGLDYIDELIQVAINQDVLLDTAEQYCERVYFALQDAHYNVVGLATAKGHLVERYEYTPYGDRQVFSQPQPLGDFSGDGGVEQSDLDAYLLHYGQSTTGDRRHLDLDGSGTPVIP